MNEGSLGSEASIVVYYDLEKVDSATMESALRVYSGQPVIEACAQDTVLALPETRAARFQRMWASRDPRFLSLAMDLWNEICTDLPQPEFLDVSILSTIRYEWLYALERYFYRSWVVSLLIQNFGATKILWVSNEIEGLASLKADCEAQSVEFWYEGQSTTLPKGPSSGLGKIRLALYPIKAFLRHRRTYLKTKKSLGRRESASEVYLLAEFFPSSGALVANTYGRAFEQRKDIETVYLAGQESVARLWQDLGLSPQLVDWPNSLENWRLSKASREIDRSLHEAWSQLSPRKLQWGSDGPSFKNHLIDGFRGQSRGLIQRSLQTLWQAHRTLREQKISALVSTTYASVFGAAWCLVAKEYGIPTVYAQHGLMVKESLVSYVPHDLLLLWGNRGAEIYRQHGISTDRLRVVGMLKDYGIAVQAQGRSLNSKRSSPLITYFASRTGGSFVSVAVMEKTLQVLRDAVLQLPDASLVVKLHPGDHTETAFRTLVPSDRVSIRSDGVIPDLIQASDIVIVTSSTVGLEVCSEGRPLIVFDLGGIVDFSDYERFEAALCVRNPAELHQAILSILEDSELRERLIRGQERFSAEVLGGCPVNVADRAVETILEWSVQEGSNDFL